MTSLSIAKNFVGQGKKIIGIGRNYIDHAKELKNNIPKKPFFFLKPTSSYLLNNEPIQIPKNIICHHEVELGVIIGKSVRSLKLSNNSKRKDEIELFKELHDQRVIGGYCLSIDLTARNLQDDLKSLKLPWSSAKGFDTFQFSKRIKIKILLHLSLSLKRKEKTKQTNKFNIKRRKVLLSSLWFVFVYLFSFCPVGKFIPTEKIKNPNDLRLWLKVNDQIKQNSSTRNMIFKIPELISYCSGIMTLEEGDLILTGTPAGVSQIKSGDKVEVGLEQSDQKKVESLDNLKFDVIESIDGLSYDDVKPS